MYVVRMIEVVKKLCDALRGVIIELDATGIFNDETWQRITKPETDAPLHRLHRKSRRGLCTTARKKRPHRYGNTVLKFLRRVDRLELWIDELGRTPAASRWPDRDRWPYMDFL